MIGFQVFEFTATFIEVLVGIWINSEILSENKTGKKKIVCAAIIVSSIAWILNQIQLFSVVTSAIGIIGIMLCAYAIYRVRILDSLIVTIFYLVMIYIMDFLSIAVFGLIFQDEQFAQSIVSKFSMERICFISLSKMLLVIISYLLVKKILRKVSLPIRKIWIGVGLSIFWLYYLIRSTFVDINLETLWAWAFFLIVVLLVIYSAVQYLVNKSLRAENELINLQIRNQNEVNEMYHNMRALKHDMNNHLHSISGYLQLDERDKAMEYIQRIIGEVSNLEAFHSGNTTIDALIGSKTNLAKANSIRVNVEMAVPADLKISDEHLTIILGNLYDNAIDANLKIEALEKRYINIQILFRGNDLILYFENAAKEEQKSKKGLWQTTKTDIITHGFGIKNIDRIVKMHDGYCERELKDGVFVCRIRIANQVR